MLPDYAQLLSTQQQTAVKGPIQHMRTGARWLHLVNPNSQEAKMFAANVSLSPL